MDGDRPGRAWAGWQNVVVTRAASKTGGAAKTPIPISSSRRLAAAANQKKRPPWFLRKKLANQAPAGLCFGRTFMDIQIAVLCDAATDSFGKLNILGTFDTINTAQMPAIHPQCSIALRMVFSKIEEGDHKLKLHFVDEDGKSIMPNIDIPVQVSIPEDASFQARNFVINIQQLRFEKPGHYAIEVALDGRHEGSIPLLVRLMTNPPANV